eukprot:scaffold10302_cov118-Cylindrotheca_fusiformis.AAC.5
MIKAWSRYSKSDANAPLIMEQLLKRLLDERRAGNQEASADIEVYNILLDAWACKALFHNQDNRDNSNPAMASQRAREILVLLQETFETESTSIQPNEESFSLVFHVVNKVEGPTIARRVLAWMEHLYQKGKNVHAQPLKKHYIMLLDAYANDSAGLLAEGFIRHMKATGLVQPDTLCYNMAMKAWLKARKGRESAEHAQLLLEEMPEKDIVSYSSVIAAWGASGMRSHAVDRAEELLQDIYDSPTLQPNTVVLNSVMSTWVKSRNPQAAQRTRELLDTMNQSKGAYPPDLISYNTHIHALSLHAKRPGYAQRANELLLELEQKYQQRQISFRPNLFTYNLVIDAWSRATDYDAAWSAVRVLRSLISSDQTPDPDTFSFNQVFVALSKSIKPGAAALAEKLLAYMEDAYKLKMHPHAKPDLIGYTSVIVTLARSRETDAAERAEAIVQRMKERYQEGETYLRPSRACYNALIDCWAKSGKGTLAARKAEALLQEMEDDPTLSPNIVTYNAVLNSWAKSGTRCCGNQAEKYLDRMWQLYNDGDDAIAPNEFSYNTVINAISKSQSPAKAQKALRLLRRMDKLYQSGYKRARPNELTYTSVLSSCAFPPETMDAKTRRKALDTAIFTLHELQASRYGQPNEVTYGTFLQACANLLEEDELLLRQIIEATFEQCCNDGQVGEMFLAHLKSAAPDDLYHELLADVSTNSEVVNVDHLPLEWRCNTRNRPRWGRKPKQDKKDASFTVKKTLKSKLKP